MIRDRIPEIIESKGKKHKTRILDHEEYVAELKKKLKEELEEYHSAPSNMKSLEELADLLEIIYTLGTIHGGTPKKLEEIRVKKAMDRGAFNSKLFLVEVID